MFQIKQRLFMGTKNIQEYKKCAREQKILIKASVAHYSIEWPCMALCGLVWSRTAFFTLYGVLWSYMAFYGLLW